jgi:hypothetical protein
VAGQLRIAVLVVALLPLSGCFATETEIVSIRDAVKLTGSRFVHDDVMARQQTTYTWDEARRGYVDDQLEMFVRFGHLKGPAYLAQAQALTPVAGGGAVPPKVYLLGLVHVSPPRMRIQFPSCFGMRDETPQLARGLGLEYADSKVAGRLTGTRAAILGFFVAGLECRGDRGTADIVLLPDALAPGGVELATGAATSDRRHFNAAFQKACLGGSRDACYRLGQALARGEGEPADLPRAARLFEQVCTGNGGDVRACVDWALALENGAGVPRDPARALSVLRDACAAGDPFACELAAAKAKGKT